MTEFERLFEAVRMAIAEGEPEVIAYALRDQAYEANLVGAISNGELSTLYARLSVYIEDFYPPLDPTESSECLG